MRRAILVLFVCALACDTGEPAKSGDAKTDSPPKTDEPKPDDAKTTEAKADEPSDDAPQLAQTCKLDADCTFSGDVVQADGCCPGCGTIPANASSAKALETWCSSHESQSCAEVRCAEAGVVTCEAGVCVASEPPPALDQSCESDSDCGYSSAKIRDNGCCLECLHTPANVESAQARAAWCREHMPSMEGCAKHKCGEPGPLRCESGTCVKVESAPLQ